MGAILDILLDSENWIEADIHYSIYYLLTEAQTW